MRVKSLSCLFFHKLFASNDVIDIFIFLFEMQEEFRL
jgi:hypothetical protein